MLNNGAQLQWLWEETVDQEVESSIPDTRYNLHKFGFFKKLLFESTKSEKRTNRLKKEWT